MINLVQMFARMMVVSYHELRSYAIYEFLLSVLVAVKVHLIMLNALSIVRQIVSLVKSGE